MIEIIGILAILIFGYLVICKALDEIPNISKYLEIRNDRETKMDKELEQLRVQLAGCGVAALGGISDEQFAKQDDYGWSPAYQEVVNLRRKYETILSSLKAPIEKEQK